MQRDERVITIGFLYPLHAIAWVGQYLLAGLVDVLGCLRIEGKDTLIGSILHIPSVVSIQIDEIDGAEGAVLLHLANDASNAISIIGIVLAVEGHTIVANGP